MAKAMEPNIPVETLNQLAEYAKSAVVKTTCRTDIGTEEYGTAFFIRFKNEVDEICHGLLTNQHVIKFDPDDPIVDDETVYEGNPPEPQKVFLSSEQLNFSNAELRLEEASISYAFSCSRLDVTLLQFSQKEIDRFSAKKVVFLDMYKNVSVSYGDHLHMYGHPGGGPLSMGNGRLVGQPTPFICYSVDTRKGSSGSPILKRITPDRSKQAYQYQLVGIHHRGGDKEKYNCGTPIGAVLRAVDKDRLFALDALRRYPTEQTELLKKVELIEHLFGVDCDAAKGLDPPVDQVRIFDSRGAKFYEIKSGNVKVTLSHSLQWDQFTLMDVLDDRHLAVPWRDFSVDEFKAFHKLAMALQRVCSLERSEHTGTTILKSLEEHLQQILDKCSLAEFYCGANCRNEYQTDTIEKLKWATMAKDGAEHLAYALLNTRGLVSNKEELKAKLDQFKCKHASEVELIETIANCLQEITSQLQTYGCPPAELKIHVQRVNEVAELSTLIKKCLEDKEADREGQMHVFMHDTKTAAVSVWGMGGLGKTHLVLDVVRSPVVQKVFPNLIWHEVGQLTDTTLENKLNNLAESIGAESGNCKENSISAIKKKLQEPQFKETLLVIDNVWSSDVAENFLFDFPTVFTSRVRLVFDTHQRIASYEVPNGFTLHETAQLFEQCTEKETDEKAIEISEIHSFCGGHPLVVAILARNTAKKIQQGRNGWDIIAKLKTAGLKVVVLAKSESISEQRHRNVLAMLRAIMETMEDEDRNCLYAIRICKQGAKLTRNALQALWIDLVEDPDDEADYLCNQALLQEEQLNIFTIHDVIFDLIAETKTADADINSHMQLIQNFERCVCPLEDVPQQDIYMTTYCGYHLLKANLLERWVALFVRNTDFLEQVAGQGIDLFQEFCQADRQFLREMLELDTNSAFSIQGAAQYTHTMFITEVSQTLLKLLERHGDQQTQGSLVSQITGMLSKVLLEYIRQRRKTLTSDDSKLTLYLRATEVAENGTILLAALRKNAKPAEIGHLVRRMSLASFFQTWRSGSTCLQLSVFQEEAAVVFNILKNAEVWNQQPTIEAIEEMDATKMLKIAGSNALLDLYNNYENQLSSSTSTGQTQSLLDVLKIERPNDLLSKLANNIELNLATKNVMKVVLQSCVVQTHQYAMADRERWQKISRTDDCADETSSIFGLLLICALHGIQSSSLIFWDDLVGGYKNELSWKGLISAESTTKLTALNIASAVGSADVVTKLLQAARTFGEDYCHSLVNQQPDDSGTALVAACYIGHLEIVNQLLNSSADLLKKTSKNITCLQLAAQEGHEDVVECLLTHLEKKLDSSGFEQHINHPDCEGCTALYLACFSGHLQIVNQLLHKSADLFKETTRNNTCLQLASHEGHADVVETLLTHLKKRTDKRGVEQHINHPGCNGGTALLMACIGGHPQIVNKLIDNSADLFAKTTRNYTCLQWAAQQGHTGVVDCLFTHLNNVTDKHGIEQHINHQNIDGWTALHSACDKDHLQIVNKLVDNSADLFKETTENKTCLQLAAQKGHQNVVESLLIHLKKNTDKLGFEQHINHPDCDGRAALHLACISGHSQIVNNLIGNSANLFQETKTNDTCLQLAVQESREDVVEILLTHLKQKTDKYGFEQHINQQDSNGCTALHSACISGHLQIVNKLIDNYADLLTKTTKSHTCLQLAAVQGHEHVVEMLLKHLKKKIDKLGFEQHINEQDNNGCTALHSACSKGHLQVVNQLLDNSANLLKEATASNTCLQLAAQEGHQVVVECLLNHLRTITDKLGFEKHVNHQNYNGITALHLASISGHLQIVNKLIDNSADLLRKGPMSFTCLQLAVREGHLNVVQCLLNHLMRKFTDRGNFERHINHQDCHGSTALHFACSNGHLQIVKQLLNNNADLLKKGPMGFTCLQLAVQDGHQDIVECLLTYLKTKTDTLGIEQYINHQKSNGCTALHSACISGHLQIVNNLIENSADLFKQTAKNDTCLQLAAQEGHQDVVESLLTHLKQKTDKLGFAQHINQQDSNGCTALYSACNKGHLQIVNQLLENFADPFRVTDNGGFTCLHCVADKGFHNIVDVLVAHSGQCLQKDLVNHRDNHGVTALQMAAVKGHTKIVDTLLNYSADYLTGDANGDTCLQNAVLHQQSATVLQFLKHVVEKKGEEQLQLFIDHQNNKGETALHQACYKNSLESVYVLLSHFADSFRVTEKEGATCLHLAAQEGDHGIVGVLVAHAKNIGGQSLQMKLIDLRDNHGTTALQWACSKGHSKIVDILLKYSADYQNTDGDGDTCLQDAVLKQVSTLVQQLLKNVSGKKSHDEFKQFIDHQNNKGQSALHQACNKSSVEIVNILLSYLADPFLQDANGNTCLQNAVLKRNSAIVKCIVQHVKDCKGYKGQRTVNDLLNQENNEGLTAIDLASSSNGTQMLELLMEY